MEWVNWEMGGMNAGLTEQRRRLCKWSQSRGYADFEKSTFQTKDRWIIRRFGADEGLLKLVQNSL
jgi:hypothetical protein